MAPSDPTFSMLEDAGVVREPQLQAMAKLRETTPTATWDELFSAAGVAGDDLSHARAIVARAAARSTSPSVVTPEADGRYEVLAELGAGGMGRVTLVEDAHLLRSVARKELLRNQGPVAARFLREARVTAQLEHPGIVPVYEVGRAPDGRLYYTMKRVRGRTLGDALGDCNSLDERLTLLEPFTVVCQAVGYAHSKGVVHRDLKPDNVMLGPFGETLVVDWGLAKVEGDEDRVDVEPVEPVRPGDDARLTRAGTVMGTPVYMSPEQATGREVDAHSDVWSLGVMLFEIVTGDVPFHGKTLELLAQVARGVAPPLLEREPQAPRELAAIANRAMQREPGQRYADAGALAAELQAWRNGAVVDAHDYGALERLQRLARRYRLALSVVGAMAAVAAVLVSYFVPRVLRERDAAAEAYALSRTRLAQALESDARAAYGVGSLPEARAKLRSALELADAQTARLLWARMQADPARFIGRSESKEYALAFHPAGEWVASAGAGHVDVWDPVTGARRSMPGIVGDVWSLAVAADGNTLFASDMTRRLLAWDLETGRVREVGAAGGWVRQLALSASGAHLLYGTQAGALGMYELATGTGRVLAQDGVDLRTMRVSPADVVATGGADGVVRLWPPGGASPVAIGAHAASVESLEFTPQGGVLSAGYDQSVLLWSPGAGSTAVPGVRARVVAVDPSGTWLASAQEDGTVQIHRQVDGTQLNALPGHEGRARALAVAPDGELLASAGFDGTVRLWDPMVPSAKGAVSHADEVVGIAVHARGGTALSGGWDGRVLQWDLASGRASVVAELDAAVRMVAVSPDGRWLATASNDHLVRVLSAASQNVTDVLGGFEHMAWGVAFSPDSKRLAATSYDGTVRIWDVASGTLDLPVIELGPALRYVAWSPDGRQLAVGGVEALFLLDTSTGRTRCRLPVARDNRATQLAFSRDGARVASGDIEGRVHTWDVGTCRSRAIYETATTVISGVAFTAGGDLVASGDGLLFWWDAEGRLLDQVRSPTPLWELALDGTDRIVGSSGAEVASWRVSARGPEWTRWLIPYGTRWMSVGVAGVADVPGARVGAAPSDAWKAFVQEAASGASQLAPGPDGRQMLTVDSQGVVRGFDLERRALLFEVRVEGVEHVLPIAGGFLAQVSEGVQPWRCGTTCASGATIADTSLLDSRSERGPLLMHPDGVVEQLGEDGAWTPSAQLPARAHAATWVGSRLAVGYASGVVHLLGSNGAPGPQLEGTPGSEVTALVSVSDELLAAGFADGTVVIWQVDASQPIDQLDLHGRVTQLVLHQDALLIATRAGDVRTYDLSILHKPRCALLDDVWREVPVTWIEGGPQRTPPPADHACRAR